MKTTSMIALIAVISAVSIGTISLNGFSAIPLVAASVSPESGTFMGHVEYILRDSDGNIKSYVQGDNLVVNKGDDCVIGYAFQTGITSDNCTLTGTGFRYIGVGNGSSSAVVNGDTTLDGTSTTVASSGVGGLMSMKLDTDTVGTASSSGGTVVIATETPFVFTAGTNTTTVTGAGLFDGTCTMTAGVCTAYGSPNMFSAQRISVAVAGGDSLSVTWTITVGNAS
jgi:hypothetical protein